MPGGYATFTRMVRVFMWFFRWICLAALLCFAVAVLRAGFNPLRTTEGWKHLLGSPVLWVAVTGFALRILLTRLRRQDPLEFLDTLEHELTHALTGYLTFAPPMSLTATLREGGEVELPRRNPIAVLSPYFLPLYATLVALSTLVLKPDLLPYGRYAVGFLLGSFLYRFRREFHFGQTDFGQYGFIFSLAFVAAMLPLSLAGILEAARLWHFPWRDGIWPVFVEQGHTLGRMVSGLLKKHV